MEQELKMIYLKRFGWFLLIVIGITVISIFMTILTKLISDSMGAWGLVSLLLVLVLLFAIGDVQLDKYIKRKIRKNFDSLRKDSGYMFGDKK